MLDCNYLVHLTNKAGKEQLLIFVATIIFTLATDLLVGIAAGILVKIIIHLINGVPFKSLFKPFLNVEIIDNKHYVIDVEHSAIFSNYIGLKKQLDAMPRNKQITIDFTNAKLVDHSVMEHIHEMAEKYNHEGGHFTIKGLHNHKSLSAHPHSTRKKM